MVVLAPSHNVPVFRTAQLGLAFPCLLSPAILEAARGVIGSIPRPLRVVTTLRHDIASHHISVSVASFSGGCIVLESGLYLEPSQSRNSPQLPRGLSLHGPISSLGANGIQPRRAWGYSQGRDMRCCGWPYLVLLQRCISVSPWWSSPIRSPDVVAAVV